MSEAIKLIVDGYLTLKDRQALEDLRAHRQRLRKHLQDQPKSWVDLRSATRLFDEDIRVIEAAIDRL
jgi:urease accessory protein UreE